MKLRVAINGFGRIGRNVLRAIYENNYLHQIDVIAINDLCDVKTAAHLLKYDSIHGHFNETVNADDGALNVAGDSIFYLNQSDPGMLPWDLLQVDCVLECSGQFNSKQSAGAHIAAGAKQVLVSAPATDADATIVFGVNDKILTPQMQVVSNASCTTNCLAPIAKVLNDCIGIEQGQMTTIHAMTNDQSLLDVDHNDFCRARSAPHSMIPTQTGAAHNIGKVLPELEGKLQGMAVRVPTLNVSLVDFHFLASRETNIAEVNQAIYNATQGTLGKVLEFNDIPLVSIDFNHNPASAIFDATQTNVAGRWVKVMAWYDNEWGFSNRMLDTAITMAMAQLARIDSAA